MTPAHLRDAVQTPVRRPGDGPAPAPVATPRPRTLGILGGMSWESTAVYYRLVNQGVARHLGGLHSARLVLHSVDFAPVAALQAAGDWSGAAVLLADAAAGLRQAGAQALLIATNTMHKVAPAIRSGGGLPLLHIASATGGALAAAGVRRAALLGTRYTMEDPGILREPLARRFGIETLVPAEADRALIHRVIFEELCRGTVDAGSRAAVQAIIERQRARGAEAVILGCTELMLLIDADAVAPARPDVAATGEQRAPANAESRHAAAAALPVFDTTTLHAAAAVRWLLGHAEADADLDADPDADADAGARPGMDLRGI